MRHASHPRPSCWRWVSTSSMTVIFRYISPVGVCAGGTRFGRWLAVDHPSSACQIGIGDFRQLVVFVRLDGVGIHPSQVTAQGVFARVHWFSSLKKCGDSGHACSPCSHPSPQSTELKPPVCKPEKDEACVGRSCEADFAPAHDGSANAPSWQPSHG